jgi:TolB protein
MRNILLGVLFLAGAFPFSTVHGQVESGVRLGLTYQAQFVPGLVMLPLAATPETEAASRIVEGILRQDIRYSNRFQVREPTGARAGDAVNLTLWKERGADWVVDGTLNPGLQGGTTLWLRLHDAVYGSIRIERSFRVPNPGDPGFRMAVHAAADDLVLWATGEPGHAATRIAFVLDARGSKEIYSIDYDGENVQRVTGDGSIALSPAWSPDGLRMAYTSYRSGAPFLYERDLATGRDRLVSNRDGINITPSYAPDGRTLAFSVTVSGNTELALFDRDRGSVRTLTQGRRSDSLSPSYSPDGRQLAFVSNRLGEPHIYLMPATGGDARMISDFTVGGRGYNTAPDFAPRGNRVAYQTRLPSGQMQIVVVDLDRGTRRVLTSEGSNEDPSWAPDGRHLVFASRDREGGGLFIVDTVTGDIRPLLRGKGYGLPAWSTHLTRTQR